jgi:hypothetical protein
MGLSTLGSSGFPALCPRLEAFQILEQFHASWKHEIALAFFARTFGRKTGFHFS